MDRSRARLVVPLAVVGLLVVADLAARQAGLGGRSSDGPPPLLDGAGIEIHALVPDLEPILSLSGADPDLGGPL